MRWVSEEVVEAAVVWAAGADAGAWEDRAPQALEVNAFALIAVKKWIMSLANHATTTSVPNAARQ